MEAHEKYETCGAVVNKQVGRVNQTCFISGVPVDGVSVAE
jgi:hypothetical protein